MNRAYLAISIFCGLISISAHAREPIRFSELIMPLKSFTEIMWQPFTAESGYPRWLQQYGSGGMSSSTIIQRLSGGVGARLTARSLLDESRQSRRIELKSNGGDGEPLFAFTFLTSGKQLAPYDINKVIRGDLPFFPEDPNSTTTFSFSIQNTNVLTVVTNRAIRGEVEYLRATYSSTGAPFLTYSETSAPTVRELTYEMVGENRDAEIRKFSVRKTQHPGQWEGTETLSLDDVPASLEHFNTEFRDHILLLPTTQWPPLIQYIQSSMQAAAK